MTATDSRGIYIGVCFTALNPRIMKTILGIILLIAVTGCSTSRELQAEMVRAELVKIDTVQRHSPHYLQQQLQLTWRDSYDIEYVTYVPVYEKYILGSSITMLKTR
jgi:hypothetical protein